MTLRHIRLFIEVYKTQNITKAAKNLNMTQPTVTRAIHELEEHYHLKLFERINNRLRITEAGKRFYSFSLKSLETFEHMEQSMLDWHEKELIKIGSTASIGSVILPQIIKDFNEKYPQVQIKSIINNTETLDILLENNDIDFALIEGAVPNRNVYYEEFNKDKLVLILPPDDPRGKKKKIELSDLENDSFLLRESGSSGRNYVEFLLTTHGLPINPVMESISTHAIVQGVHSGLGVAIIPEDLVEHSISSGFVASCGIKEVNLTRRNYIVWHEGKFITSKMKTLIDMIKHHS